MDEVVSNMECIKEIKAEVRKKIDMEIEYLFSNRMKSVKAINSKEATELFCEIEKMELCLFGKECIHNPNLLDCFYKEMNIDNLDKYVVGAFGDLFYGLDKEAALKQRNVTVLQKITAFCMGGVCSALIMAALFFYFAGHCM